MAGWIDRWRSATVALGCVQNRIPVTRRPSVADGFCRGRHRRAVFIIWDAASDVLAGHGETVFADPAEDWRPSTLDAPGLSGQPPAKPAQIVDLPLQLTKAGRRCWFPHPDRTWISPVSRSASSAGIEIGPAHFIAWMDIATTVGLYEGAGGGVGISAAFDIPDSPRAIVGRASSPGSRRRVGSEVFDRQPRLSGVGGGPVFPGSPTTWIELAAVPTKGITLLGIVTQARIQSLPLLAGGGWIYVEGKKASEPLTPGFLRLGLVGHFFASSSCWSRQRSRHRRRKAVRRDQATH
ncbi:MAG: hypothetical protein MRJ92_01650 [Nitrospira sp.]|nr:hypothetical protein [Nitrospira sp.]